MQSRLYPESGDAEQAVPRAFVNKAAYVAPVIAALAVAPSFANAGSVKQILGQEAIASRASAKLAFSVLSVRSRVQIQHPASGGRVLLSGL